MKGADRVVMSVFPDAHQSRDIDAIVRNLTEDWKHVQVTGARAEELLHIGVRVRQALGGSSALIRRGQDIPERVEFSRSAQALSEQLAGRCLIASPSLVPLDLVSDDSGFWGERCIFSHWLVGNETSVEEELARILLPAVRPLGTYLLVCPMAMDRSLARHDQDIVTVALSLEHELPVEIWLQSSLERAIEGLRRTDLSWLHIDTHGDREGQYIMVGPSRRGRDYVNTASLPESVPVPFVMVVGCGLTARSDSIGSMLFRHGAQSVLGPCTTFQSLGITDSEEGEARWYENLLGGLLAGQDVGRSLLRARSATAGGILKYAWVIIGSSLLRFSALPW